MLLQTYCRPPTHVAKCGWPLELGSDWNIRHLLISCLAPQYSYKLYLQRQLFWIFSWTYHLHVSKSILKPAAPASSGGLYRTVLAFACWSWSAYRNRKRSVGLRGHSPRYYFCFNLAPSASSESCRRQPTLHVVQRRSPIKKINPYPTCRPPTIDCKSIHFMLDNMQHRGYCRVCRRHGQWSNGHG